MTSNLRPLTVVRFRTTSPMVYCFSFKSGGWAHFSVNDETGELSIQSDWGNYGHRWSTDPKSLGDPNLSCFLARCGAHYIVDKLSYDEPRSFKQEFDEEATRKEFFKYVVERRREQSITKDDAAIAWYDIKNMECTPEELYYNFPENLAHIFSHLDVTEYFVYKPSLRYRIMVELLIPLFQEKLKEQGYGKEQKEANPPA